MSTERVLAKADELKDGEMKEIEVSEDLTLLLVRRNGVYRAFGGTCPHHGASLAQGILHDLVSSMPGGVSHPRFM